MKKFILGFILGACIFSIFPIYAATQTAINVTYNNIKLSVRGEIIPTDVEPFVFNNRTFVPARFIAEALGMDVKYNEVTDTVEITDKIAEPMVNQNQVETAKDEDNGVNLAPPPTSKPKVEGIDSVFIDEFEGTYYIKNEFINNYIRPKGYEILLNRKTEKFSLIKTIPFSPYGRGEYSLMEPDDQILIEEISSENRVTVDYYVNTILPFIK